MCDSKRDVTDHGCISFCWPGSSESRIQIGQVGALVCQFKSKDR
jgi:hypothetical protein